MIWWSVGIIDGTNDINNDADEDVNDTHEEDDDAQ